MDSSVSRKDEMWFLRVRHHISAGHYHREDPLQLQIPYFVHFLSLFIITHFVLGLGYNDSIFLCSYIYIYIYIFNFRKFPSIRDRDWWLCICTRHSKGKHPNGSRITSAQPQNTVPLLHLLLLCFVVSVSLLTLMDSALQSPVARW